MVRFSKEWLAIHEAKRTQPEVIKARQEKADEISERKLQDQMAALLGMRDIIFIRPMMCKKSTIKPGWPDFTFAVGGKACAIEAKVGNNNLDYEQLRVIGQMQRNGWKVQVVRSIQEFKQFLDEMEL